MKIITFLRWLFASETIATEVVADDVQGIGAPRRSFTRWMLKADALDSAHPEGVAVARRQRFLLWVFATETLSAPPTELKETPERSPRFWSWLICPEDLSQTDDEPSPPSERTMFFRRLIAPEVCPEERGVAATRRVRFASRLLAPEQCPSYPVQAPGRRRSWLGRLLETEECPVEPSPTSLRRRGFWRNLLALEKL